MMSRTRHISVCSFLLSAVVGLTAVGVERSLSARNKLGKQLVESLNSAIVSNDLETISESLDDTVVLRSDAGEWKVEKVELLNEFTKASVKSLAVSNYSVEELHDRLCVNFDQRETMIPRVTEIVHDARYKYCFVEHGGKWILAEIFRSGP